MKILKITPRGFCKGVVDAYVQCKKIAKLYPNREKYLIGWLVHNKEIIKELEEIGITTKNDNKLSRMEIIENIKIHDLANPPIVIFSAHGTDRKVMLKAKERGLLVIDTTCVFVTKTHQIIQEKIKEGYQILYIGVVNHPETISTLAIDESIKLITNKDDIKNLKISNDKPIFVTNQTTISIYEFVEITNELSNKFKNIEFKNDICNAAKDRQDAIINMPHEVDLLIVVGDSKSNNSKKLVDIGVKKGIESYLVLDTKLIKKEWFKNKKYVAITSGCSTPTWLTNYVIMFLEKMLGNKND